MPSDLANDSTSPLAIDTYRRLAELQVVFGSICSTEDCPLTEVQEVLLAQTVLQVMDGLQETFATLLTADAQLRTSTRFPYDPEVTT